MTNENLLSAFRFHRSRTRAARKWQAPAPNPAWDALNLARRDVAAGTARYSSSPWARGFPPVNSRPDSDGTYFIQDPESVGLRLQYEGRELPGIDHGGWYTNPYGESFRDGSGLCYGAIFLLPGKGGKARAVAGYKHGGQEGYCVDLGTVYTVTADDLRPELATVARVADSMAEHAGAAEREYQTAWQAGTHYADTVSELSELRQELLEVLAARRASGFSVSRKTLIATVSRFLESICELKEKARNLREGDYENLMFYTGDSRLQSAFCEGAGLSAFPGE